MENTELMELIIALCVFVVMLGIVAVAAILIAYGRGYKLGNKISKDTIKLLTKSTEENIKLKEKALVTNDVIYKHFKNSKKQALEKIKANQEAINNLDEIALKNAFGEYGDMFKEEIENFGDKKNQEEFKLKG